MRPPIGVGGEPLPRRVGERLFFRFNEAADWSRRRADEMYRYAKMLAGFNEAADWSRRRGSPASVNTPGVSWLQ